MVKMQNHSTSIHKTIVLILLALLFLSSAGDTAAEQPLTGNQLSAVNEQISLMVQGGFLTEAEIIDQACLLFNDEIEENYLQPEITRLTREQLRAHGMQQQTWPKQTDCDRLDAAFAEMQQLGIAARQNFSCCGTCGVAEIWSQLEVAQRDGARVRGYTFYHMQDTEAAVEGAGLYLNYGRGEDGEGAALAIGRELVDILNRHGLKTSWDGSWNRRIHVELDWKRRRKS